MHFDWLVPALLALLVVITFWIVLRRPPVDSSVERQARELRDEVQRSAQGTRQELVTTLGGNGAFRSQIGKNTFWADMTSSSSKSQAIWLSLRP
jgi:hypothetical protein